MAVTTSTVGYPRIGKNREVKKALESHWKGNTSVDNLLAAVNTVQHEAWVSQKEAGIDLIGLDGTLYDQVLDWIYLLGLEPERFEHLSGYAKYFAMARGHDDAQALDMSKLLDTNYHYLVPELTDKSEPKAKFDDFLDKVKRGQKAVGVESAVPIVIGPNTVVGLASGTFNRSSVVKKLVPFYKKLLGDLKELGVPEVQIHEHVLTLSHAAELKEDFQATYTELAKAGIPINLVAFYDDIGEAYPWVVELPVQAITLDFLGVPGSAIGCNTAALIAKHGFSANKRLGAGVIDGRSVWADDGTAGKIVAGLLKQGISKIAVTSSVSLQHLPIDKNLEKNLPSEVSKRLSFAEQKLQEIVDLAAQAPNLAPANLTNPRAPSDNGAVPTLSKEQFARSKHYKERRESQIKTPAFPTSTIGSFPQTAEIRRARLQFKNGSISEAEYRKHVETYIADAIKIQDSMGIDVHVHGEPERTDMVEYFGQQLEGFTFTDAGWVQSYGSRFVRPPIIHANVRRRSSMTVREFTFAQSLTAKPVKGMLTGPVTILNWSFPRKDISRKAQAFQLALAVREEVADLEKAGCKVIQVDEPALREGLPLKKARWESYLAWAVDAFRLSTAVAAPATQVVTHLCYSDFNDILPAIDGLDADVLTIENSRSGDQMLRALTKYGYSRDLGAGVYDVHSPVVPSVGFLKGKLQMFLDVGVLEGNAEHLWVVPDCGLKTRDWKEVVPALQNMVEAAKALRAAVATN